MDEQELNTFLKTRHVPDAPSNLATRIIAESRKASQGNAGWLAGVQSWANGFAQSFVMPQPALVLGAFALLALGGLGVFGVASLPSADMPSEEIYEMYAEADDISLAFYVEDIFEY